MYYFSKRIRIKCLDCGKNYKGAKERKERIVYFCAGYANYGKDFCSTRWKIDQDYLVELCIQHFEITLIKSGVDDSSRNKRNEKPTIDLETILERVHGIEVSPKEKTLRINYTNGTSTQIKPRHLAFYVE